MALWRHGAGFVALEWMKGELWQMT